MSESDLTEEEVIAVMRSLPSHVRDKVMPRLMVSPNTLRQEAVVEAVETLRGEFEKDFDIGTQDDWLPEFWAASKLTAELGIGDQMRTISLRYLNADDSDYILSYVPDIMKYVFKGRKNMFAKRSGLEILNDVLMVGLRDRRNNKPTDFNVWCYEAVARLLSNPGTGDIVTGRYLRSIRPGLIIKAMKKLYSVNVDFFCELWDEMPTNSTMLLGILTGTITSLIGKAKRMLTVMNQKLMQKENQSENPENQQETSVDSSFAGTMLSGGGTNSTPLSAVTAEDGTTSSITILPKSGN